MKLLARSLLVAAARSRRCPNQARNDSIKTSRTRATRRSAQKQFETAIERYQKAIEQVDGQPPRLVRPRRRAHRQRGNGTRPPTRSRSAVQVARRAARCTRCGYGFSLYEKAVKQARDDQARKENKKPEEVQPDLTAVNFEKPLQHLRRP